MPQVNQGLLIAVEGIDGSGKTTLAHAIATSLRSESFDTLLTKEPGGTTLGQTIRAIVQKQETPLDPRAEYLLFAADRAQHCAEIIRPALEQKKIVISDRLADSSLAYQGYGRGLDRDLITTVNNWALNTIQPDITVYVRMPVDIALSRIAQTRTLSAFEKHASFLEAVLKGFEELYKDRTDVITLDGTESPESVAREAVIGIEQWIQKKNLLS